MIKSAIKLYVIVFMVFSMVGLVPAFTPNAKADPCASEVVVLTVPPWYHNLCKPGTNDVKVNGNPNAFASQIAINLLNIALQIGGYLALGYVIWGGIKYVLAAGDSGKLSSAKTIIQNALIGLLLSLSAVAILNLIQINI